MHIYDTIIIGAGIAGATIAHSLNQKKQSILVLDKKGIASGASGAAGAFVSPKIGKGSPLQELTNEAFEYAKDFYLSTCPKYFHQTGVIRIPKDEVDAEKFSEYEKFNHNTYELYSKEKLESLGISAKHTSFYFPEAGDCDAVGVCRFLLKGMEFRNEEVLEMTYINDEWKLITTHTSFFSKNVVIATGYESNLVDLRYMGIRGRWGTRGDFYTSLDLKISMHQSMSVGANNKGVIKLGATHEKDVTELIPCSRTQAEKLKEKASSLIDTSSLELQELFCGMRAGSRDYFPLVGKVIDVVHILEQSPAIVRGAKPDLKYKDNLYVINGLGGRGFVFAPLMSKILTEHIVDKKDLDTRVNPDRLFLKWCRKL